jgi:hypothetical protein
MHAFLDVYYIGGNMQIALIAQSVGKRGINNLEKINTHEDFMPFPPNPKAETHVLISYHVTTTTMACEKQEHE